MTEVPPGGSITQYGNRKCYWPDSNRAASTLMTTIPRIMLYSIGLNQVNEPVTMITSPSIMLTQFKVLRRRRKIMTIGIVVTMPTTVKTTSRRNNVRHELGRGTREVNVTYIMIRTGIQLIDDSMTSTPFPGVRQPCLNTTTNLRVRRMKVKNGTDVRVRHTVRQVNLPIKPRLNSHHSCTRVTRS